MLNPAAPSGLSALALSAIFSFSILLGCGADIRAAGQGTACQGEYEEALSLILQARTVEARDKLRKCLSGDRADADLHYQLARTHIIDFNQSRNAGEGRQSLGNAVRELDRALAIDPEHLNALRLKYPIHRGKGSIHYDPGGAYELARKVMDLQPSSHPFVLNVAEWMGLSGVRFYVESEDRVPHDSMIGLDRAASLLKQMLGETVPFTPDEESALILLGKVQAKSGRHAEAVETYQSALLRRLTPAQRIEAFRGVGISHFRLGNYAAAGKSFLNALQIRVDPFSQWLFKLVLDRLGNLPVDFPPELLFPLRREPIDPANPPLLEFTDVAAELGVNRRDGHGTCAWGDYDGDGDLDLLLGGRDTFIALYRNDGRRFVEVTDRAGLSKVPSGYSLNFVDFDNDGAIDVYVCLNGWSGPMANRLFRNRGNGTFDDVSQRAGVADPGSGFVSLWGDLDNDGDLDLVVGNGVLRDGSTTQIYRNNGDGTFANVTRQAGLAEPPEFGTIGIALGDYDRDGDLDLFINGWAPAPNRLYRNNGNLSFTEVARQAGVVQPAHAGYVCFFFDYDNDAYPDILATSLGSWPAVLASLQRAYSIPNLEAVDPNAPRLFRNNRDGTFTDATWEAKLYYPVGSMGAGVADVDNDGYIDLFFGTGDPQLSRLEPNRFFRNNGDGTFSDLTMTSGLGHIGKGHGVTFIDYDEDGDLDIYAQIGAADPGDMWENAFYQNQKANRNHWLQVDLAGTRSNRHGVGATLVARAGGLTLHREVKGSEGFGSTNPYRVSFGLGPRTRIDSLDVIWPSGEKQTFHDLPADRLIAVKEGEKSP